MSPFLRLKRTFLSYCCSEFCCRVKLRSNNLTTFSNFFADIGFVQLMTLLFKDILVFNGLCQVGYASSFSFLCSDTEEKMQPGVNFWRVGRAQSVCCPRLRGISRVSISNSKKNVQLLADERPGVRGRERGEGTTGQS